MQPLTKDALLSYQAPIKKVALEEFGFQAFIRMLTVREIELISAEPKKIWALSLCDEDGILLFESDEVEEIMKSLTPAVIKSITRAILDANGLTKEAQETVEGNSGAAPSGDS